MSDTNTIPALKQDANQATNKVQEGAQKLADKAGNKAEDVAPKSEGQSILEQGQKVFNDATSYVQKQAGQVFGGEGSQGSGAAGESESVTDQARKFASDALNNVSGFLQKTGDKAGAAASDASKPDGQTSSYVEQARKGASDLLGKAQEQLNGGSNASS